MSATLHAAVLRTGCAPVTQQAPLWRDITLRAAALAQREPWLAPRLEQTIFAARSPASMLARVLARRLANGDWSESELHAIMCDVMEGDLSLLAHAEADIAAVIARDPACPHALDVLLNLKGFHALQAHRVAHRLWLHQRTELAFALSSLTSLVFSVDIHPAARIGCGVMLDHADGVVIGETALVEDNVSILQHVTLGGTGKERGDRHPKIRSGVMLGAGAKVLGNIEVGTMSLVAAGSVVLADVPPHTTVAGVPAVVVRRHGAKVPALSMEQSL